MKRDRFPLFRHHRLYRNCEQYQKFKYISKKEFERYRKLKSTIEDKKRKAIDDLNYNDRYDFEDSNACDSELAPCEVDEPYYSEDRWWNYSERYGSMEQRGYFYYNTKKILDLLMNSDSKEQFRISCTLNGIEDRYANYAIVYIITSECRYFDRSTIALSNNRKLSTALKKNGMLRNRDLEMISKYMMILELYGDIVSGDEDFVSFKEFSRELI